MCEIVSNVSPTRRDYIRIHIFFPLCRVGVEGTGQAGVAIDDDT